MARLLSVLSLLVALFFLLQSFKTPRKGAPKKFTSAPINSTQPAKRRVAHRPGELQRSVPSPQTFGENVSRKVSDIDDSGRMVDTGWAKRQIDRDLVVEAFQSVRPLWKECGSIHVDAMSTAKVVLDVTIASDGRGEINVAVHSSSEEALDEQLEECLRESTHAVSFPRVKPMQRVKVTWPISLKVDSEIP